MNDVYLETLSSEKEKPNLPDPYSPIIASKGLYQEPDCADTKLSQ